MLQSLSDLLQLVIAKALLSVFCDAFHDLFVIRILIFRHIVSYLSFLSS